MKIKELKGLKSVKALNVYMKLVIGIAMTYFNKEKSFDAFLKNFEGYDLEKKRTLLKLACLIVQLEEDEVEALTRFAVDDDDIAYERPALSNLKTSELVAIMVEVLLKISEVEVFF
ncbi:MAG: hypothetical protein LBT79_03630 [Elusimicrobiota bacterium]|jgi:hypothetical protein|nr:hypothetical protein [Elusimicrobiota bacterium]